MAWLWQHVTQHDIDVVLIQEPYITGTNVVAGVPSGYKSAIGDRPRGANGQSRGTQLACLVYKAGLPLMQDGVVTTSHTVGAVMRTNPRLLLVCSYMAKDTEVTREAQRWTESDNWKSSRVLVAADTNAKSHLWHSGREDGRGQELEAFILGQGLAVVNRVSPHFTFEGAQGSSNIDLTLAGHSLANASLAGEYWG
ncbi:unnamed protein product [Heterosigma akashiwo]